MSKTPSSVSKSCQLEGLCSRCSLVGLFSTCLVGSMSKLAGSELVGSMLELVGSKLELVGSIQSLWLP